jgi:hypothetical protein
MVTVRSSRSIRSTQLSVARRNSIKLAALAGARSVLQVCSSQYNKTPRNTSKLSGMDWVRELSQGHRGRFYDNLGMNRHVFRQLLQALIEKAGQGNTKHVTP